MAHEHARNKRYKWIGANVPETAGRRGDRHQQRRDRLRQRLRGNSRRDRPLRCRLGCVTDSAVEARPGEASRPLRPGCTSDGRRSHSQAEMRQVRQQESRADLYARHHAERLPEGNGMTDKPATTYIVSVFDKPHWRAILTTKDKAAAEAMEQGDDARRGQGADRGDHAEGEEALVLAGI